MRVGDAMTRDVAVPVDATMVKAAELMRKHDDGTPLARRSGAKMSGGRLLGDHLRHVSAA